MVLYGICVFKQRYIFCTIINLVLTLKCRHKIKTASMDIVVEKYLHYVDTCRNMIQS